jgi:transcriptional regulator with XRE-family HTH domain
MGGRGRYGRRPMRTIGVPFGALTFALTITADCDIRTRNPLAAVLTSGSTPFLAKFPNSANFRPRNSANLESGELAPRSRFTTIAYKLSFDMSAASILRNARARSGLSQRRLAALSNTTQSVVARIESGAVSPGIDTLTNLLAAAGFELEMSARVAVARETHMLDDVERILSLSPANRLRELSAASRFFSSASRV